MHNIKISCPATGKDVATVILADAGTLKRMPEQISNAHCPHCGGSHPWSARDAWLANGEQRSDAVVLASFFLA